MRGREAQGETRLRRAGKHRGETLFISQYAAETGIYHNCPESASRCRSDRRAGLLRHLDRIAALRTLHLLARQCRLALEVLPASRTGKGHGSLASVRLRSRAV